jgi:hypothetical protein
MVQGAIGVNILSSVVGIGGSNVSAFGDLIAVDHTPVVQLDFVYGINTQTGISSVNTTGVVDTNASRLRIQTGVGAAGSGIFQSSRIARYRAGQGMMTRFTGVWTTSAANSTQVIGVGNAQVGYFFGFNGTSFGISIRNGGSDNWTAQSSWNGDKCDGTGASGFNWNKTTGNVMMIRYPFLGYGAITFSVQNPTSGAWILCHTIQYPNSSASLQLSNPSFPFYANATNSGSTTNLIMYVGSVGIFISGTQDYLAQQYATDNNKAGVTAETNIFSIRNCTTYNGVTNVGMIRFRSISLSYNNGTNGFAVLRMRKGATLGGVPAYTPINGSTADNGITLTSANSIASVDTAATTSAGGFYQFNLNVGNTGQEVLDISPYLLYLNPGEIMTFGAFCTVSGGVQISTNWNEDV